MPEANFCCAVCREQHQLGLIVRFGEWPHRMIAADFADRLEAISRGFGYAITAEQLFD